MNQKQESLRRKVCAFYPWMTAELFELEGYLGWGPGHREYDGEGYPDPTPDAPDRLQWFQTMLGPLSDLLDQFIDEANDLGKPPRTGAYAELCGGARNVYKPSAILLRAGIANPWDIDKIKRRHQLSVQLLATALKAREARRPDVISRLYAKIADNHSPYVLGGARMYLHHWRAYKNYNLVAAGLIWLLANPLTPEVARAENYRRRVRPTQYIPAEKLPDVLPMPQSMIVQECRI